MYSISWFLGYRDLKRKSENKGWRMWRMWRIKMPFLGILKEALLKRWIYRKV